VHAYIKVHPHSLFLPPRVGDLSAPFARRCTLSYTLVVDHSASPWSTPPPCPSPPLPPSVGDRAFWLLGGQAVRSPPMNRASFTQLPEELRRSFRSRRTPTPPPEGGEEESPVQGPTPDLDQDLEQDQDQDQDQDRGPDPDEASPSPEASDLAVAAPGFQPGEPFELPQGPSPRPKHVAMLSLMGAEALHQLPFACTVVAEGKVGSSAGGACSRLEGRAFSPLISACI
jgi:hypothetical protein